MAGLVLKSSISSKLSRITRRMTENCSPWAKSDETGFCILNSWGERGKIHKKNELYETQISASVCEAALEHGGAL